MPDKTPIRMLHDRVLVSVDRDGERRSSGGIVIPATAAMGGRRLAWSRVAAVGPHVRTVEIGDRVLFDPEDKAEVEVNAETYVLLRERDLHAVAADRWERPYRREEAAFPAPWVRRHKFWPAVARIDNVYGDRNLMCSCPPLTAYEGEAE